MFLSLLSTQHLHVHCAGPVTTKNNTIGIRNKHTSKFCIKNGQDDNRDYYTLSVKYIISGLNVLLY